MSRPVAVPICVGLAIGCGGNGAGDLARVGEPGPEAVEGVVRVIGAYPFERTVVEGDDGESVQIAGAYDGEVARLSGARVRVTGSPGTGELPGPALDATSYEILSVDGDRPVVGVLASDDGGHLLRGSGGREHRLSAVSEGLAGLEGALVWVVLDERNGVARYGLLREAVP